MSGECDCKGTIGKKAATHVYYSKCTKSRDVAPGSRETCVLSSFWTRPGGSEDTVIVSW